MNNNKVYKIWTNGCRFFLAILFVFSAFVKAVDPVGVTYKVQDYLIAFGLNDLFPEFVPFLLALLLTCVEFMLSIYLLFGIRRSLTAVATLLFMGIMTPFTLYLAIANPVSHCGCFGDAWVLTNWETFGKNVILLIAAISVFKWKNLMIRLFTPKTGWLVSIYSLIYFFLFTMYCLHNLPVLDFRPYKLGTDIAKAMELPEDGSLDKLPSINDFWMVDTKTGEDKTFDILNDSSYTFLMVAYQIEKADDSNIDLINELYDYAADHKYAFYALTASNPEAVEVWCDRTGAEYPFLQGDEITLKTIIRSNPGVILLKNGVIYKKWSDGQLPDEYVLTDRLENLPVGELDQKNDAEIVVNVILSFFIPLGILLLVDLFFIRKVTRRKKECDVSSLDA